MAPAMFSSPKSRSPIATGGSWAPVGTGSSHSSVLRLTLPQDEREDEEMREDRDIDNEDGDDGSDDEDSLQDEHGTFAMSTDAREILQPLELAAARVSRQVEDFAKRLDKFNTSRDPVDQSLWRDAEKLLDEYSGISEERKKEMARIARSRSSARGRPNLEAEVQKSKLEVDLWSLTGELISRNSPESVSAAHASQQDALDGLHRYSSNSDIWKAFLDSDVTAQEYEAILSWLQTSAASSPLSIEDVLQPSLSKTGRGEGLWTAGPLYTRQAIKAEKRRRQSSRLLEPSRPGMANSLVRKRDGRLLVTELDPDAKTRQGNGLEDEDEFYDETEWQACWELMRRGKDQSQWREWWTARKESWRAASLRGSNVEDSPNSPWYRIRNLATNSEWASQCITLCQKEDLPDYQAAVYGLICGDLVSSTKVARTIDDNLFSSFNYLLISRYQGYLAAYRRKLEAPEHNVYVPPMDDFDHIRQYTVLAQSVELTRNESRAPHKSIEAAILSKDFEDFFLRQGNAAAQFAHDTNQNAYLFEAPTTPANECAQITSQDADSIRIIAHLQLVLKSLGLLQKSYFQHLNVMENNIVHYIAWLQSEGKFTIIPLYASKLSPARGAQVLGSTIMQINDIQERALMTKLMKQYGISTADAIWSTFNLACSDQLEELRIGGNTLIPVKLTESVGPGKVQRLRVRSNFIGDNQVDEPDTIRIEAVEWFRHIDIGDWSKACWAATSLYKIFLFEGKLAAAKLLLERASLKSLSLSVTKMDLNAKAPEALPFGDDDVDMDGIPLEERTYHISPTRRRLDHRRDHSRLSGTSREVLAAEALGWSQLEQLIAILIAFEQWAQFQKEAEASRSNVANMRVLKRSLQKTLGELTVLVGPIVEPTDGPPFLTLASDTVDSQHLHAIRMHYIPEIILAYNSVLDFSGHAISRSWLVQCMTLVQLVASNDSVLECFKESKRMEEVVGQFALDSHSMLHANELGSTKTKRGKKDAELDLWRVKFDEGVGEVNLEDLDQVSTHKLAG